MNQTTKTRSFTHMMLKCKTSRVTWDIPKEGVSECPSDCCPTSTNSPDPATGQLFSFYTSVSYSDLSDSAAPKTY